MWCVCPSLNTADSKKKCVKLVPQEVIKEMLQCVPLKVRQLIYQLRRKTRFQDGFRNINNVVVGRNMQ